MSKQTAVEWLVKKLNLEGYDYTVEQAKEMEKKDMIEFSQQVFRNRYNEVHQSLTKIATDTYNETYGGNK